MLYGTDFFLVSDTSVYFGKKISFSQDDDVLHGSKEGYRKEQSLTLQEQKEDEI